MAFAFFVIGLLCVNVGPQMIHSLIHRRGGPVFFMLSLIPFLLLLWWLRKGEIRARPAESRRASSRGRTSIVCCIALCRFVDSLLFILRNF